MRQVGCYSVWVSPFLPICRWVGLCQIIFDNLPCLSTAQNICNMHRWSRYLLGTSVLLWCTEQLDRSECWDRSLGCPLLLLHSNPQASHCRTWAQCWCGISQQLHSQRGRCPCGSAGPCHEQRTWKKDGNYICLLHCNAGKNMLLMVSLLQWQEVVLAIFLTGWSGSKCPLNALRQKWLIKKLTLRFPSFFFPSICWDGSQLMKGGGRDISAEAQGFWFQVLSHQVTSAEYSSVQMTDAIWQIEEKN